MAGRKKARYAYGTGLMPEDEAPATPEALGKHDGENASAKSKGIAALRPLYAIERKARGVTPWSLRKS